MKPPRKCPQCKVGSKLFVAEKSPRGWYFGCARCGYWAHVVPGRWAKKPSKVKP